MEVSKIGIAVGVKVRVKAWNQLMNTGHYNCRTQKVYPNDVTNVGYDKQTIHNIAGKVFKVMRIERDRADITLYRLRGAGPTLYPQWALEVTGE